MSIGGFGALRFAMLYPDQFGISVSLMGATMIGERARDDQHYDMFHKGLYVRDLKGVQGIRAHFVEPPLYYRQTKSKIMSKKKWFIQCRDQDFHSLPNAELHVGIHKRGIPHQNRVASGDNNNDCYSAALPDAIALIHQSFRDELK